MLHFASADLAAWIAALILPFFRVAAMFASAPIFSARYITIRTRLGLALLIAILIAPTLPAPPAFDPLSIAGVLLIGQQILIGVAIGFVMRIIFAAVEFMGDLVSLQMGLGIATLYDPQNGTQVPVLGQFMGVLMILVFLSVNGHLLLISSVADSFRYFPIAPDQSLQVDGWWILVSYGSEIFRTGLILALPIVAVVMISNIVLAVVSKSSPQLNIFAIGFPIFLGLGLWGLSLLLPYLAPALVGLVETATGVIEAVLRGFSAR